MPQPSASHSSQHPTSDFHPATANIRTLDQVSSAITRAVNHKPRFDQLMARFNFGKNLFYKGVPIGRDVVFSELQRAKMGTTFKSVYSNAVSQQHAPRVEQKLRSLGLKHVANKSSVTAHFMDQAAHASYAVSFIRSSGSGSSLSVRKIKSATTKLFFLTSLGNQSQVDFRVKVLAMYHFKQGSPTYDKLQSMAETCSVSAGNKLLVDDSLMQMYNMAVDRTRFKTKKLYEGDYTTESGEKVPMKVSIVEVTNESGIKHTEMAGCCPELNTALMSFLEGRRSDDGKWKRLAAAIQEFGHCVMRSCATAR